MRVVSEVVVRGWVCFCVSWDLRVVSKEEVSDSVMGLCPCQSPHREYSLASTARAQLYCTVCCRESREWCVGRRLVLWLLCLDYLYGVLHSEQVLAFKWVLITNVWSMWTIGIFLSSHCIEVSKSSTCNYINYVRQSKNSIPQTICSFDQSMAACISKRVPLLRLKW